MSFSTVADALRAQARVLDLLAEAVEALNDTIAAPDLLEFKAPAAFDRADAAAYCALGETTFAAQRVPSVTIGARRLWRRSDLDAWLSGLPCATPTARLRDVPRRSKVSCDDLLEPEGVRD